MNDLADAALGVFYLKQKQTNKQKTKTKTKKQLFLTCKRCKQKQILNKRSRMAIA